MRVTQQTIRNHLVQNVQDRLNHLDRLNRQIGSGVRIEKPSDDPVGASRIVRIEEVVARNDQYLKNIDEALSVHAATDASLDQVYRSLTRAKSLAVEGASSASTSQSGSFTALGDEVAGIRDALIRIANGRFEDNYLFNGGGGEQTPFSGATYQGDSEYLKVNTGGGQSIRMNLPGDLAFRETEARSAAPLTDPVVFASPVTITVGDGVASPPASVTLAAGSYALSALETTLNGAFTAAGVNAEARINADQTLSIAVAGDTRGGVLEVAGAEDLGISSGTRNVFALLDDLESALRSEDVSAVSGLLDRLDGALGDVATQRGVMGARSRNLEFARDRLQQNNLTSEALRADIEGVDLPEAIMKVSAEEQAYQTALASGARLLNVSILDYLR